MGRKITSTDEATAPTAAEEAPAEKQGVTFICNYPNQLIKFADGTSFTINQSRFTLTDPDLIANIRAVADEKHIFEVK